MASDAQVNQRRNFVRACACFARQPQTGGATPPATGPRSREWWHTAAAGSGQFYYNYFMAQTLAAYNTSDKVDWCGEVENTKYIAEIGNDYPDTVIPISGSTHITRGNASQSLIYDGTVNTIVRLGIIKIPVNNLFPCIFNAEVSPMDASAKLWVMPYPGEPDLETLTWNTAFKNSGITSFHTVSSMSERVDFPLNGFPSINDFCYFLIGQLVPSIYNRVTVYTTSAYSWLQF